MVGGSIEGFNRCDSIFKSLSANYKGEPCYALLGPSGSGHYIKMVHNGIEYALMQLIAEYYFILINIFNLSSGEALKYLRKLNKHNNKSYLLQITENILQTRECNTDQLVLEMIKFTWVYYDYFANIKFKRSDKLLKRLLIYGDFNCN